MGDALVNLERVDGTSEEERRAFLRCLYSHIEGGPNRNPVLDRDREPDVADGLQPVIVPGAEDLAAGREAVARVAEACDQDWQRLYRLPSA